MTKCFIFIILFHFVSFAQEPMFSSASKNRNTKINNELKVLIDNINISGLNAYIQKFPKNIDDPVSSVRKMLPNRIEADVPIPVFHYITLEYLKGNENVIPIIQWYIANSKTDLNTDFEEHNVFYFLLKNIAQKKDNQVSRELELVKMLLNSNRVNAAQSYKSYPAPLSFLLNTHFRYLNNKYDKDYLNIDIVYLLLDNGATLETYDSSGNNLMALALTKNDNVFIDYLISKKINLSKTNTDGKDPLFFAIKNANLNMVNLLIEELNKKITPSYLYLIEAHLLDVYKNKDVAETLLKQCYPNIKDMSDVIIFSKIFHKEKSKLLNPIPIKIETNYLADFVNLFNTNELNATEQKQVFDLKTKYLNASTSFKDLKERLSKVPLFSINHYFESDQRMLETNNLVMLKNEIDNLSNNDFSILKNKLYAEHEQIRKRCQNIEENNRLAESFKLDIVNTDNIFFVGEGDGATFWEMVELSENFKFRKYKLCVISFFKNNSNKNYKIKNSVFFYFTRKSGISFFNVSSSSDSYLVDGYIEIGPGEELPVFSVLNFKEDYQNFGVINLSKQINMQKPFQNHFQPYFGEISQEYRNYQKDIFNQLVTQGKLTTKKGYDQMIANNCNNCIIDEKKSNGPKWEVEGLIWKDLVERPGAIVMKNGTQYAFKKKIRNNKPYYIFLDSIFGSDKEFNSFDDMLNEFIKWCKKRNCN